MSKTFFFQQNDTKINDVDELTDEQRRRSIFRMGEGGGGGHKLKKCQKKSCSARNVTI